MVLKIRYRTLFLCAFFIWAMSCNTVKKVQKGQVFKICRTRAAQSCDCRLMRLQLGNSPNTYHGFSLKADSGIAFDTITIYTHD